MIKLFDSILHEGKKISSQNFDISFPYLVTGPCTCEKVNTHFPLIPTNGYSLNGKGWWIGCKTLMSLYKGKKLVTECHIVTQLVGFGFDQNDLNRTNTNNILQVHWPIFVSLCVSQIWSRLCAFKAWRFLFV